MFIVYILYSKTLEKYYCGQTANFLDRIERHNSGRSKYTKSGIPWEIIHTIECDTRSEAVQLEQKIKKRGIRRFLLDNHVFGV